MTDPRTGGRLQLLMIAAIFIGPMIVAWLLYSPEGDWQPPSSTANGELLEPITLVTDEQLNVPREEQNSPYPGLWTLVQVGSGACDEYCSRSLYETRQVRKAMGKEDTRVQRIMLLTDDLPLRENVAREHPGLILFRANSEWTLAFVAAIELQSSNDVYLVDPLGNLIMRFPAGTPMKDMHKDLKKLLSISQIG